MDAFNPIDNQGNPILDLKGIERPIVSLIRALEDYAWHYSKRGEGCPIGEDYILGDYWLEMARCLRGFLDGPTGRLNCGAIDSYIRDLVKKARFDHETLLAHGFDTDLAWK